MANGRHAVGTDQHESVFVDGHLLAQPPGVRFGSDEHEQSASVEPMPFPRGVVLHLDLAQDPVALELANLGRQQDLDTRHRLEAVDQVARHVLAEIAVAHDEANHRGAPSEERRRLPGRISAPDEDDGLTDAQARFDEGGGVVHARALEAFGARLELVAVFDDEERRVRFHLGKEDPAA
jgi:hypothetical protein